MNGRPTTAFASRPAIETAAQRTDDRSHAADSVAVTADSGSVRCSHRCSQSVRSAVDILGLLNARTSENADRAKCSGRRRTGRS